VRLHTLFGLMGIKENKVELKFSGRYLLRRTIPQETA
jgi:hypothetical protein